MGKSGLLSHVHSFGSNIKNLLELRLTSTCINIYKI